MVREAKEVYLSEIRRNESAITFLNESNLMKINADFSERSFKYFDGNKMNDPESNSDFWDQLQKVCSSSLLLKSINLKMYI